MSALLQHGTPECVSPMGAKLGEGPLWDPRDERLYWLDIKGEKIFRYDPREGVTDIISAPEMVSALGLARSGGYVGVNRHGFLSLVVEDKQACITPLIDPEQDIPDNRFNDGKVDPAGGYWAGSMDNSEANVTGSWWRFSPCGEVERIDQGFHVPNGPAFDTDRARVFFTDSAKQTVFVADSDGASISNKEVFLQFGAGSGYPDGMEVDAEGYLWIAFWDGGVVRRFSPDGSLCGEIAIPAARPTSIAHVNDALFVTTASVGLSEENYRRYPQSGGLFRIPVSYDLGTCVRYFDDENIGREVQNA